MKLGTLFLAFGFLPAVTAYCNDYLFCGTCVLNSCVFIQALDRSFKCISWDDYASETPRKTYRTLARCEVHFKTTALKPSFSRGTTAKPRNEAITKVTFFKPTETVTTKISPQNTSVLTTTEFSVITTHMTRTNDLSYTTDIATKENRSLYEIITAAPAFTTSTLETTTEPLRVSTLKTTAATLLIPGTAIPDGKVEITKTPEDNFVKAIQPGTTEITPATVADVVTTEYSVITTHATQTTDLPYSTEIATTENSALYGIIFGAPNETTMETTTEPTTSSTLKATSAKQCKKMKPIDVHKKLKQLVRRFRLRKIPLVEKALRKEVDRLLCRLAYFFLVYNQTWNLGSRYVRVQIANPMWTSSGPSKTCKKFKNIKL